MASIAEIKKEVDETAQNLKLLSRKSSLTPKEEDERHKNISKLYNLLMKYAMKLNWKIGIKEKDYIDNPQLCLTVKDSLNKFLENDSQTYFNLFLSIYQEKIPDIKAAYFDLSVHENNKGRLLAIHKFIKELGAKYHIDNTIIKAEIKKRRRPNYKRDFDFANNLGCGKEEFDKLDEIYDFQYASSIDAQSGEEDENNQTYMEAEASIQKDYDFKNHTIDMWDNILAITHEEAKKKGPKDVEYMRGYWTIQFIEEQIGKKQAKIWEIYIMLLFFMTYEHLYSKHGELMDLMANQFNLKRRAWHNHYVETFNDICRYIRKMHILKEDSYE